MVIGTELNSMCSLTLLLERVSYMKVLDQTILGGNDYLCGAAPTIADYQASSFVALAELIGCDFAEHPNVKRWLGRMKALKFWKPVNEAIDGYAATLKGQPLVSV